MDFGLLVSGDLGCKCLEHLAKIVTIKFVMTDKNSEAIQSFCNSVAIPCFVGNSRKKQSDVKAFLSEITIDHLISINYIFLVDSFIIDFPKGYAINFHGSLLPKYRGRTPHVWAIINGEKFTGATAHMMVEECDAGPIVIQKNIRIEDDFTGFDILSRFQDIYIEMLGELIIILENSEDMQEQLKPQDETKATYFGKRTPEDGLISWDWFKERILNWVRAQSYPYPGAYTYCNGQKIIVDKVQFTDIGFDSRIKNGTVIGTDPFPLVKVGNGVLKLSEIRNPSYRITIGDIFGTISEQY